MKKKSKTKMQHFCNDIPVSFSEKRGLKALFFVFEE